MKIGRVATQHSRRDQRLGDPAAGELAQRHRLADRAGGGGRAHDHERQCAENPNRNQPSEGEPREQSRERRIRRTASHDRCDALHGHKFTQGCQSPSLPASRTAWPWQTESVSDRHQRLAQARLYLVCDVQPDKFVAAALDGGVDVVQLRCKSGSDAEVVSAAERFVAVCRAHDALFIVNDRPDLAVAVDADGVHVGQDDVAVTEARALVGPERIVGLSTHSPEQIDAAAETGVDYIGVGPVHATPTKPGRPAVGVELVSYAAAHASVPFFAIGGINPSNVDAVVDAGAERIVVVRALTESANPSLTASVLRTALRHPRDRVGAT